MTVTFSTTTTHEDGEKTQDYISLYYKGQKLKINLSTEFEIANTIQSLDKEITLTYLSDHAFKLDIKKKRLRIKKIKLETKPTLENPIRKPTIKPTRKIRKKKSSKQETPITPHRYKANPKSSGFA